MKVLVLNCGSSSIKYKLFEMEEKRSEVIVEGIVERVGNPPSRHEQKWKQGDVYEEMQEVGDHAQGLKLMLDSLSRNSPIGLKLVEKIEAVGHRVVHGGEEVTGSVVVDEKVLGALRRHSELAPLHNPPNIAGIEACQKYMPDALQTAVFDNALHHTLPPHVYTYALPRDLAAKYRLRRYGFHGIAFRAAFQRAEEILGVNISELKVITLMLGSGCTANAYLHGRSVEVSTGFTPLEGMVQSTRTGDLDPAVPLFLMEKEGLSPQEMSDLLNRQSGLLGLSGISADMRDLEQAAERRDSRARLAIDAFVHRARKCLGAYAAIMCGLDCLLFAGGIGANSPLIRAEICRGLEFMGLSLDEEANRSTVGKEAEISSPESKVKVLVVQIDEELVIAQDTYRLVTG